MSLFRRSGGAQTVENAPPIRVSPPLAQNPQTAREPGVDFSMVERRVITPTATPTGSHQGLTAAEQEAIEMTARLWDHLAMWVVDRGPSCSADLAELAAHVHGIQRAVLANAAARAYPDRYRILGGAIPEPGE